MYVINQDSFYRELSPDEQKRAKSFKFNFDHPDAVDIQAVSSSFVCLSNGIEFHIYTRGLFSVNRYICFL